VFTPSIVHTPRSQVKRSELDSVLRQLLNLEAIPTHVLTAHNSSRTLHCIWRALFSLTACKHCVRLAGVCPQLTQCTHSLSIQLTLLTDDVCARCESFRRVLDAVFDQLDDDLSGTIRFAELAAWLPPDYVRPETPPHATAREGHTAAPAHHADHADHSHHHKHPVQQHHRQPLSAHRAAPLRSPSGGGRPLAPHPLPSRFHPRVLPASPRHTSGGSWLYMLTLPDERDSPEPRPADEQRPDAMTMRVRARDTSHGGIVLEADGDGRPKLTCVEQLRAQRRKRPAHKWTTFALNNMWVIRPCSTLAVENVRVWRDAPRRKKPVNPYRSAPPPPKLAAATKH
jgi:hypothetical protein